MLYKAGSFEAPPTPEHDKEEQKALRRPHLKSIPYEQKVMVTAEPDDQTLIQKTRRVINRTPAAPRPSKLELKRQQLEQLGAKIIERTDLTPGQLIERAENPWKKFWWKVIGKGQSDKEISELSKKYKALSLEVSDLEGREHLSAFHQRTQALQARLDKLKQAYDQGIYIQPEVDEALKAAERPIKGRRTLVKQAVPKPEDAPMDFTHKISDIASEERWFKTDEEMAAASQAEREQDLEYEGWLKRVAEEQTPKKKPRTLAKRAPAVPPPIPAEAKIASTKKKAA